MSFTDRIKPGPDTIATEASDHHYMIVVLRDDQLEAIRQIVREEIRAALANP